MSNQPGLADIVKTGDDTYTVTLRTIDTGAADIRALIADLTSIGWKGQAEELTQALRKETGLKHHLIAWVVDDWLVTKDHVEAGLAQLEFLDNPIIAEVWPASRESVQAVRSLPINENGRSDYVWVRLANGDLMLATFPQGDGYFDLEGIGRADLTAADKKGPE